MTAISPTPPKIHGQSFGLEKRGHLVVLWIEDDGLWYESISFDRAWARELMHMLRQVIPR